MGHLVHQFGAPHDSQFGAAVIAPNSDQAYILLFSGGLMEWSPATQVLQAKRWWGDFEILLPGEGDRRCMET